MQIGKIKTRIIRPKKTVSIIKHIFSPKSNLDRDIFQSGTRRWKMTRIVSATTLPRCWFHRPREVFKLVRCVRRKNALFVVVRGHASNQPESFGDFHALDFCQFFASQFTARHTKVFFFSKQKYS